jgi:hypothetical protein
MPNITVHAGDVDHASPLIVTRILPADLAFAMGDPGESSMCTLRAVGEQGTRIAAQYDRAQAELTFIMPGTFPVGTTRRFVVEAAGTPDDVGAAARYPVALEQKLDRVVFHVAGAPFAVYNFQGARRPYFWPVLGPAGASVVRGQGTAEHPHHTGMCLNYGGHSEGGSSNIWSDWDEPPYGPGGRMVHRAFLRVVSGPVYGELVEELSYVNAGGDPIVEETRTIRCWWASDDARFIDFQFDVRSTRDRGPQPFLFMLRLPGFFDIPNTGKVANATGHPVPPPPGQGRIYRAAWIDGSGPTGGPPPAPPDAPPETLVDLPGAQRRLEGPGTGPWNGIALFDSPENDGFPGQVGKYAVPQQITQCHYPPAATPHGPFSFRHRVYVHAGDATSAGVAGHAASYARHCKVEVTAV